MGLIETHDSSRIRDPRTVKVFVEFRDGCVGRIFATGDVEVNLYLADSKPAVIHGQAVHPSKQLFDVVPDFLTQELYAGLLAFPESLPDRHERDRISPNGKEEASRN